ncbi:MAG TPA: DegT/DnrJ/EryC1/StrS family aminotransferase [Coleofasciculaceae cyanobacterium]
MKNITQEKLNGNLSEQTAANSHRNLAIFGGTPAFPEKIHVGRPNIGNRHHLLERINDILDRKWLSNNGKYVQEFEARLAEILGAKHCIVACNGTVALEIVARAANLTGEVIVPSFTFIATAHAMQWLGLTPVFCDIDPQTHTIDPAQVEKLITPRTSAILGVHVWGQPCNVDALADIARRHNLKLMFDAAHAFHCSYNGRMLGNFGDAEILSFHATKFLNTFEGGAIITNDDELAQNIRQMKSFGFATGYDNVTSIGTNGKMNEVCAAMGVTGLDSLDDFIAINYRNYKLYQQELAGIPGVRLFRYNETEKGNYQYIVLEIDETITHIDRDRLVEILHAENILARRYFYPGCHQMEPYRSLFPDVEARLPETNQLVRRVMTLPTGTAMKPEDIHQVCQIIRFVVENGPTIRQQLA